MNIIRLEAELTEMHTLITLWLMMRSIHTFTHIWFGLCPASVLPSVSGFILQFYINQLTHEKDRGHLSVLYVLQKRHWNVKCPQLLLQSWISWNEDVCYEKCSTACYAPCSCLLISQHLCTMELKSLIPHVEWLKLMWVASVFVECLNNGTL